MLATRWRYQLVLEHHERLCLVLCLVVHCLYRVLHSAIFSPFLVLLVSCLHFYNSWCSNAIFGQDAEERWNFCFPRFSSFYGNFPGFWALLSRTWQKHFPFIQAPQPKNHAMILQLTTWRACFFVIQTYIWTKTFSSFISPHSLLPQYFVQICFCVPVFSVATRPMLYGPIHSTRVP